MTSHNDGSDYPVRCDCHDHGPKIEGFVVPCLLLLIKKQAAHGYEIMEKLNNLPFIDTTPDPGVVYRHLRRLEEEGKVKSRLEPGSGGPARKVYSLTHEGEDYLDMWAVKIKRRKASLELFLDAFSQYHSAEK